MGKHTPGPWIKNITYLKSKTSQIIAFTNDGDGSYREIGLVAEDNADIITTAPEMLSLLIRLRHAMNTDGVISMKMIQEIIQVSQKAEGKL